MKACFVPELKLYDDDSLRHVSSANVRLNDDEFSRMEQEKKKKLLAEHKDLENIRILEKKMAEEKQKPTPDTLVLDRYQYQLVVLRKRLGINTFEY